MAEPDQTIAQAFRAQAARRGDQPVIIAGDAVWTFSRLDQASDAVAGGLVELGAQAGDRIGLFCLNGPEFVVAYLAILKAGATVVPINLMLNPRAIGFILNDAGASGLFYSRQLAEAAAAARQAAPGVRFAISVGEDRDASAEIDALMACGAEPPACATDAGSLAAVLYTSGTTGRPKGAMLSHRNLMSNTASVQEALSFQPGVDRILLVLPMFHAFAATVGMLTPLVCGLTLVIAERFEPRLVSAAIETGGATIFLGVPSMFSLLLRLDDAGVAQWRTVRACISGGAAMPKAVMEAFEERFGIPVLEGDGPTECSPVTCVNPIDGPRKPGSVGLPLPGVEMRVVDEQGATMVDGAHGEVCVRGPNVMLGYLGLEEESRQSFYGDWFRTGDLGYRDGAGYFYLVDRIKDLIITNGMNIYPRIIEEVLYQHPAVAEAAVVGEPQELHGEIPVAYVAIKPGAEADPVELRNWCRDHLGRHEVPRRVELVDALPRNAAGKILKRELRRQGELERGVDHPPPDAPII